MLIDKNSHKHLSTLKSAMMISFFKRKLVKNKFYSLDELGFDLLHLAESINFKMGQFVIMRQLFTKK